VSRSNSERDPQNHGHSQTTLVGDFGTRGRVPLNGSGILRKTLKVLRHKTWRVRLPAPMLSIGVAENLRFVHPA